MSVNIGHSYREEAETRKGNNKKRKSNGRNIHDCRGFSAEELYLIRHALLSLEHHLLNIVGTPSTQYRWNTIYPISFEDHIPNFTGNTVYPISFEHHLPNVTENTIYTLTLDTTYPMPLGIPSTWYAIPLEYRWSTIHPMSLGMRDVNGWGKVISHIHAIYPI